MLKKQKNYTKTINNLVMDTQMKNQSMKELMWDIIVDISWPIFLQNILEKADPSLVKK